MSRRITEAELRAISLARDEVHNEYRVTVHVDGRDDETYDVVAPREGMAQTHAMVLYQQPLNGEFVSYTIDDRGAVR